jgi:WD40 repeat protein
MIFSLIQDFADVLAEMPKEYPRRHIVSLLDEAIRRDVHFIDRHPTTLFQCLWNSCWWYDAQREIMCCAESSVRDCSWITPKLSFFIEAWKSEKERATPGFRWMRSSRPPALQLGSGQTAVLRGHAGVVTSIAYSDDGLRLVSGSRDKTIRVWDTKNGNRLACLTGHESEVTSLAFSPNGRHFASASNDKSICIWDIDTSYLVARWRGHSESVTCVAYSPDGKRIASGSNDGTVRLWDAEIAMECRRIQWNERLIRGVTFSPDGNRLASCTTDRVCIWDCATGAPIVQFDASEAYYVTWTPDGRWITAGPHVWNALTGERELTFQHHEYEVFCSACSPDGRWVASGSLETVRVWDRVTGEEAACFRGHEQLIYCLAWCPNGKYISSGSEDGTVRIWATEVDSPHQNAKKIETEVAVVNCLANGHRLVTINGDTISIWDPSEGKVLSEYAMRGAIERQSETSRLAGSSCVAISASGDRFVVLNTYGVQVWNVHTGQVLAQVPHSEINLISKPKEATQQETQSPQAATSPLRSGGLTRLSRGLPRKEGELPRQANQSHKSEREAVKFLNISPDGKRIVLAARQGGIRLMDAETGNQLNALEGHIGRLHSIYFSADNQQVISIGEDLKFRVWNAEFGNLQQVMDLDFDAKDFDFGKVVEKADNVAQSIDPWEERGVAHGLETEIRNSEIGEVVAWIPSVAAQRWQPLSGNVLAGTIKTRLFIFLLEGDLEFDRSSS